MENRAQVAARLRDQMELFLGNLPKGIPKPARRFCLQALYGIATSGSVRLSEIARSLREPIPMIKTENRLSRQAGRPGLDTELTEFVIAQGAPRVGPDTLLIVDPSDIAKAYARKMEYLARVRDGSRKELADGYWLCQILAVEPDSGRMTPLVQHLWSHEAPGFRSENEEILGCMERVMKAVGSRGTWVMDRGGDRREILEPLLKLHRDFLIRLRGDRTLKLHGRTPLPSSTIAEQCPLPYAEVIRREEADGSERLLTLEFGFRPVTLPFSGRTLSLVVVRGFGREPLMLLTTRPLRNHRQVLWSVLQAYLTRWRIEETLRWSKQAYDIEDVRVLRYQSLKNMMALVLLVMFFTMVWLGQGTRLRILAHHALRASRRLFGIPDFRFYALADGIRDILAGRSARPFSPAKRTTSQPDLFGFNTS